MIVLEDLCWRESVTMIMETEKEVLLPHPHPTPQLPITSVSKFYAPRHKNFIYYNISLVIFFYCYAVHVVELLNYYTNHCTYIKFSH